MQHTTPLIMLAIDAFVAVRPSDAEERFGRRPRVLASEGQHRERPLRVALPTLADDVAEEMEYERWDGLA